jgi:hypothetical protein
MDVKTPLSVIGVTALVLWTMTIAALGWFFVKGWTVPGADGRTEIVLAPAERDQILAEMRQLLKAVDGVIRGLGEAQARPSRLSIRNWRSPIIGWPRSWPRSFPLRT